MVDGAHSEAEGANKAAYLIKSLGALIGSEKRKFAVAKIELFPCVPSAKGVNHDAVRTINNSRKSAESRTQNSVPSLGGEKEKE